jgi:hypothetical protein
MTNIVFTLSADSLHELRMQACKALDLQFKSPLLPPVEPAPEIKPTTAAERKKQEARDKLRGKPAATPKPQPVPGEVEEQFGSMPSPDGVYDDGPEMPPEPAKEPFVDDPDDEPEPKILVDTVADENLKREVINSLSDLFTAGKVKIVRHVLDKYGDGAKSFPEIDASKFRAIKDAIMRGEAA